MCHRGGYPIILLDRSVRELQYEWASQKSEMKSENYGDFGEIGKLAYWRGAKS
jgi:hypothetical protein